MKDGSLRNQLTKEKLATTTSKKNIWRKVVNSRYVLCGYIFYIRTDNNLECPKFYKLQNIVLHKINDMKKILPFIFIFTLASSLFSQDNSAEIEITDTDITLYPDLKSNKISVFGIQIGMTRTEVNKILSENSQLHYHIDDNHTSSDYRIYVYDRNKDNEKQNCILYLIWTDNNKELTEIVIYGDFAPYLKGATSKLLTFEGLDYNSKLSKDYLGYPNKTKVTLDVPPIGLKETTYYYYSKGIKIMFTESSDYKTVFFSFFQNK